MKTTRTLILTACVSILVGSTAFAQKVSYYKSNDKYGYKNEKGEVVLEAIYENSESTDELIIALKDGKWRVFDINGQPVTDEAYDEATFAWNGSVIVCVFGQKRMVGEYGEYTGSRYGLLDRSGKEAVPLGTYGYLMHNREDSDESGNLIAGIGGKVIRGNFHREFIEGKYRILNYTGKALTNTTYDGAKFMRDGLIGVKQGEGWGVLDAEGKVVIAPKFEDIGGAFGEGLLAAKSGGKWGFIDATGKVILPFRYTTCGFFNKGLSAASFSEAGGYGYIDRTGKEIIPFVYDYAGSFDRLGFAYVEFEGRGGAYIDTTGAFVEEDY